MLLRTAAYPPARGAARRCPIAANDRLSLRARSRAPLPTPPRATADSDASTAPTPAPAPLYALLAGTSVALGAAAIAAPELLIGAALPAGKVAAASTEASVRAAGATLLGVSAASEWAMHGAIVHARHRSATYARLAAALVLKGAAYAAAAAAVLLPASSSSLASVSPLLLPLFLAAGLGSSLVSLVTVRASWSADAGKPPLGGKMPQTPEARAYLALALGFFALAALPVAAEAGLLPALVPIRPCCVSSPPGLVARLAQLAVSPGLALAAGVALVQADAAERGRLGASTFVLLNKGLAVTGLALAASAASRGGGVGAVGAGVAGALVLSAAFTAFQALTAKKK
jgi:hypothetical protein